MDVRAKAKPPIQSSSSHSLAPAPSSTPSITPAASWDGWPDGHLQYLFSPQEIAGTNQLEMDWVCELLPGKRGSPSASVWQKGKEIRRQCVGILESLRLFAESTATDSFKWLAHVASDCDFADVGGAFFIHSGDHTHSEFTHSLCFRPHEPFVFAEYTSKYRLTLDTTEGIHRLPSPSSSTTSSPEWQGIQEPGDSGGDSEERAESHGVPNTTITASSREVALRGQSTEFDSYSQSHRIPDETDKADHSNPRGSQSDWDAAILQELLEDPEADDTSD
ncbi:hypothetical protein B0H17DRAFT_1194151 [Mycena rosella]|uniref:Uncharacterized protein n=1 Tax=Mycena rosella TaxID=1033263 RepID=A0AAD7GRH3_MYCRO|nr:hypothetical protein B0H17DRAFT_1194151 [Mycena rosella]